MHPHECGRTWHTGAYAELDVMHLFLNRSDAQPVRMLGLGANKRDAIVALSVLDLMG